MGLLKRTKSKKNAKDSSKTATEANSSGGGSAGAANLKKVRPDVVDTTRDASDGEKREWAAIWQSKVDEFFSEGSKIVMDENLIKEQNAMEESGVILAPSMDCISLLFDTFLCPENPGLGAFLKPDWDALGTDMSPFYDADQDFLKGPAHSDVDVGMEFLVFGFVKKITAARGCAMLDLFKGMRKTSLKNPEGVPLVGPATDFHSYTWQESVTDTVAGLVQHLDLVGACKETRYFWWDIFCQNQWNMGDVGKTFTSTIKQITHLCFSTPNLLAAKSMTRVWCQYELATAVINGKTIMVLPGAEEGASAWGESEADALDQWVPVEESQAKYMEDKKMLLDKIDAEVDGGRPKLNQVVKQAFVSAADGYRLWYTCNWYSRNDDFEAKVKKLLAAGADPNFTNGYRSTYDMLSGGEDLDDPSSWSGAFRALVDAGAKSNDAILESLDAAKLSEIMADGDHQKGVTVKFDAATGKANVKWAVDNIGTSTSDYLALYKKGAAAKDPNDYQAYVYATGKRIGEMEWDLSEHVNMGVTYTIGYVLGRECVCESSEFGSQTSLPSDNTISGVFDGDDVQVRWALNVAEPSDSDFFGVYEENDVDGTNYIGYAYNEKKAPIGSGTITGLSLDDSTNYVVKYIDSHVNLPIATSKTFTKGTSNGSGGGSGSGTGGGGGASVEASLKGDVVSVSWSSISSPSDYDYLAIYEKSSSDGSYITYEYNSASKASGNCSISVSGYLTAGTQYDVRYISSAKGDKSVAKSGPFTA